jgi:GTP cyclohydrolase II
MRSLKVRAEVGIRIRRGEARFITFRGLAPREEHFALALGPPPGGPARPAPLVRIHSECITGDLFGSSRCDCGRQLDEALRRCRAEGGVILYLRQEGRGIGLYNKLDAYLLQERGLDTFAANRAMGLPADARSFDVAAAMLEAMGLTRVRLLTNNPSKVEALVNAGIAVEAVLPTGVYVTPENRPYLEVKARLTHHTMALAGVPLGGNRS